MLKHIRKALAVSALSLAVSSAAFAQDKPKIAFVPQLIGIPY
ncbi:MAG: autoinducer 2 ABC transporter substrate-binding protein, partial [Mesorhizobium sp.]